jgi:hypothetical protein
MFITEQYHSNGLTKVVPVCDKSYWLKLTQQNISQVSRVSQHNIAFLILNTTEHINTISQC